MVKTDSTLELTIYILYYIFVLPGQISYESYLEKNYKKSIGFGLLSLVLTVGIIWLFIYIFTRSRTCPSGHQLYIVQRDAFDWVTPEYSVYKNEAPVGNYEDEDYPPVVRVDSPVLTANEIFMPKYEFTKPEYDKVYKEGNYVPLNFDRVVSLTSLIFPSYEVTNKQDQPVAKITYPTSGEEATALGLVGLEKRYVVEYKDKKYITSEELLQFKLVEEIYFYDADDPDETPIAIIKQREQSTGRMGVYTVCLADKIEPVLKELLFATVIAIDWHVFQEEKENN